MTTTLPAPDAVSSPSPGHEDDSVLDFCQSCKKRKCPKLTDTGDAFVIEDLEQSPLPIRLTAEEAAVVSAWLEKRLSARGTGSV